MACFFLHRTMPLSLRNRSLNAVWHPCSQMQHYQHGALPLLPVVRGEGAWLILDDGQRLLDGISSWWVNLFGHCHPKINAALIDQLGQLEHVLLAGATHPPVVELSERLAALTSLGHAFYASDGASSTEIALKMSAHYWRQRGQPEKHRFLCLAGGYHGETLGALGVTDLALFRAPYEPLIRPAAVLPSPDARLATTPFEAAERAAQALEDYLAEHHAQCAALIVEPLVQAAGGMAFHDAHYLRRARALCDRYGVHLICDEIAIGFGRTGSLFAHQQAGILPDFLCLSKGLTGGYLPLSVVLCRDAIYAAFLHDETAQGFLHSHSYTGNPLACRAALTTLDLLTTSDVLDANRQRAARLCAALGDLRAWPQVRHFRQLGMILAFDVTTDPGFGRRFYLAALEQGALLRPLGNTVYLMPPYLLSAAEIDQLAAATTAACRKALEETR